LATNVRNSKNVWAEQHWEAIAHIVSEIARAHAKLLLTLSNVSRAKKGTAGAGVGNGRRGGRGGSRA
jgi:hypothetical protein